MTKFLRVVNGRPAFFYTKPFVYNSVTICMIDTKPSHHIILGVLISCVKFQG